MKRVDVDDPRRQMVEVGASPSRNICRDRRHGIELLVPLVFERCGVQPEHVNREVEKRLAVALVLGLVEQLIQALGEELAASGAGTKFGGEIGGEETIVVVD